MGTDDKSGQDNPNPDPSKAAGAAPAGDKPAGSDDGKGKTPAAGDKHTPAAGDGTTPKTPDGKETPAPGAPEKYELKRPEGGPITDEDLKRFEGTARALNLSQQQAQDLLDRLDADAVARTEAQSAAYLTELKADKDLGGDKFTTTTALAKKGLDAALHDSPAAERELIHAFLAESGLANHKALVRMFARIGHMVSEDTLVGGGKAGGAAEVSAADRLYDHPSNRS